MFAPTERDEGEDVGERIGVRRTEKSAKKRGGKKERG